MFDRLQEIFTRQPFTHIAQGFFGFDEHPEARNLFEANVIQEVASFKPDPLEGYEIWNIKWYTDEEIKQALWTIYSKYNGEGYGFLPILYFVRRWFWETPWVHKYLFWIPTKIFNKPTNIRKWNNWFVQGIICSKLFYKFMQELIKIRFNVSLQNQLDLVNANNFHPGDARTLMIACPDVFEKIYTKKRGTKE